MKFLTCLILTSGLLLASDGYIGKPQSKDGAIDYYYDGVADTMSQINKEIADGINKEELQGVSGKVAILTPLQNVSTFQIVFFKTVASKSNLFDAKTVIDKNGVSYLLYDLKTREIDAEFVVRKLSEKGIPAFTKLLTTDDKLFKDPIILSELIQKVSSQIKDLPTKIIVVEKKIYIDNDKTQTYPQTKTIVPSNTPQRFEEVSKKPVWNSFAFSDLAKKIAKDGVFSKEDYSVSYKNIMLKRGAKIEGFIINSIRVDEKDNKKYFYVVFEEDETKKEHFLLSLTKKASEVVPIKQEAKTLKALPENAFYTCDFENIKTAMLKDGKRIKIDKDSVFYKKKIVVETIETIGENVLVSNENGLPDILLNKRLLDSGKVCVKK